MVPTPGVHLLRPHPCRRRTRRLLRSAVLQEAENAAPSRERENSAVWEHGRGIGPESLLFISLCFPSVLSVSLHSFQPSLLPPSFLPLPPLRFPLPFLLASLPVQHPSSVSAIRFIASTRRLPPGRLLLGCFLHQFLTGGGCAVD